MLKKKHACLQFKFVNAFNRRISADTTITMYNGLDVRFNMLSNRRKLYTSSNTHRGIRF